MKLHMFWQNLCKAHLLEVHLMQIPAYFICGPTFGCESRSPTIIWSQPLARVWSGLKVHVRASLDYNEEVHCEEF